MQADKDDRILRVWVEIRDRRDGAVRVLPLQGFRLIPLVAKKNAPSLPEGELLRLTDGDEIVEVADLEELRTRLRASIPTRRTRDTSSVSGISTPSGAGIGRWTYCSTFWFALFSTTSREAVHRQLGN